MGYEVAHSYLERYADLLINFALGSGEGIGRGDVVLVRSPDSAKPLYAEVCRAVWRAGGNVIANYAPDDDHNLNLTRDFYELADERQLAFFPEKYWRGLIDQIDHLVYLHAVADPHALRDVEPAKIFARQSAHAPLVEWQTAKESEGRFTWTIGAYATEAIAAEAGLSLEDYWDQIIKACFLDHPDPKARWRQVLTRPVPRLRDGARPGQEDGDERVRQVPPRGLHRDQPPRRRRAGAGRGHVRPR